MPSIFQKSNLIFYSLYSRCKFVLRNTSNCVTLVVTQSLKIKQKRAIRIVQILWHALPKSCALKPRKSHRGVAQLGRALRSGRRSRKFESCHLDHMKIIRTFSYLEKRSDYLFYSSIPILIARNENSRYHGHLSMVSAFALLKKTYFYDIINTSKNFWKTY